jgi:prepilin-type N-terminal cleavage/methylation domain-containing protein
MKLRGRFRNVLTLRARRGEQGFTLVELVVTISIMGVVAVALGAAFVVSAHDSIGVSDRFAESHDAQVASGFLATDIQSNAALATPICTAGSPVIGFGYDDGTVASYCYGSGVLTRTYNGSPAQDAVLGHKGAAAPTPACVNPSGCGVTTKPTKVTLTFHATHGYIYTLSGSRRPYINGGVLQPVAPYGVLALGSGSGALSLGGSSTLNVTGPILVNSASSGAVSNNANGNGGSGIHSSGAFAIVQGGTCTGCNNGNTSPWPNSTYSPPLADPFAGLTIPDEAGQPVYLDGKNHGPGVYRTIPLTLKSDTTLSGVYILEAGMDVSGGSPLIVGDNTLLFNGCGRNAPGGCANNGQFSVSSQASLQLTPMQSGPYQLLALWQPAANTQPVKITGGAAGQFVKGIIYAPGSSGLTIGSGNATLRIWSVVGTKITIGGGGTVNVGQ